MNWGMLWKEVGLGLKQRTILGFSFLGGVTVSVLVIGPKFRGLKPGRRAIKIRSTPSFGDKGSWRPQVIRISGM
jgi:hypothetical protein